MPDELVDTHRLEGSYNAYYGIPTSFEDEDKSWRPASFGRRPNSFFVCLQTSTPGNFSVCPNVS